MEKTENLTPETSAVEEVINENESKNQDLEQELLQANDKILRLAAEAENIRKRSLKEISDAKTYAISGFAKEMLPICDSLERALATAKENEKKDENNDFSALLTGVEMTYSMLLKALENLKVRKIAAQDAIFDPNFHQAMFEIPVDNSEESGKVANVIQEGYIIGERVLRPALVGITKYKKD